MIQLRSTTKAFLAVILLMLTGASAASASSKQDTFFEAPRDLTAATSTDASRAQAFTDLASLGVKALRINLRWYDVAPLPESGTKPAFDATDPAAYAWGNYASTIDEAKARGWKVLISLSSPVPKWGTELGVDTVTRPKATEFQLFAQAAAKRFGGPTTIWSIWNEPNLPRFLMPQISGGKAVGAQLYRALFLAGRQGIRDAGQATAPVLFGELAPVGGSNDGRQYPLTFLRSALCLSSKYKYDKTCGTKLKLDGVAIHPYDFSNGKLNKNDVTYRALPRLTTVLDKAAKGGAINAKVPQYFTEFGIQSLPDNIFGVSQQKQLELRARVEHEAYSNSRVRGFSQYLLTDDNSSIVNGKRSYGGFETGLVLATGKQKLSFDGFRMVLDVKKTSKTKVSIWGLLRPATKATNVVIERRTGKKFTTWMSKKTAKNGSFTVTDKYRKGAAYRYRWTSPEGKQTSPYVKAFAG